MFKKFSRWLQSHWQAISGTIDYDDHEVVIEHRHFQVVRGRLLDIGQLIQMEWEIYHATPWDRTSFTIDLQRPNSLYLLLIDQRTQRMVAFIGASFNGYSRDVHITNFGVIPDFQRHGLGTYLMGEIIRQAVNQHFLSVSLEVRVTNWPAQRLYQHCGFITTQRRAHYYRDNGEDALDMLKKLDHEGNLENGKRQINSGF